MKLVTYGDPASAQRGVRGTTIAFPQDNPLVNLAHLPHKLSELSGSLSIVFVGNQSPTEAQLKKIFKVDSAEIMTVLNEWHSNGHPGFQDSSWDVSEIEAFEEGGGNMEDFLRHCIHRVDECDEQSLNTARQSYVNDFDENDNDSDNDVVDLTIPISAVDSHCDGDDTGPNSSRGLPADIDDITLLRAGLVNSNNVASDRDELVRCAVESLQVGHREDPVSTYGNPEYWVNSMPWLFPFGTGGAEAIRPADLTLIEWIRHCLNFHDDRFRRDPAFLFVVYKTMQVRKRVSDTKILFKRMLGSNAVGDVNMPSASDFEYTLDVLSKKKTLYSDNSEEVRKIKAIHRNIKIIGGQNVDSVYAREACRNMMMGLVVYYGLPCIFITINPSDISNPIVSFWHETGKEEFDLDTLLPLFPSQAARAKMVADDPVHGSEMFHTVIEAFLKAFLGFDAKNGDGELHGPLLNKTIFTGSEGGGLNAYFGTVECQNRGSLHLHMLVWLAGLPSTKDIVSRINAALALARATTGHPENSCDPSALVNDDLVSSVPLHPSEVDASPVGCHETSPVGPAVFANNSSSCEAVVNQADNVDTSPFDCQETSPVAPVVFANSDAVVGLQQVSEYFHVNAIGDGRCSIHATGDILGLKLEEVCKEFGRFASLKIAELEVLCSFTTASPVIQDIIRIERLSPYVRSHPIEYTDEFLHTRYMEQLVNKKTGLEQACTDMKRLSQGDDWAANDAAQGYAFFHEFVSWYFQFHRGVTGVYAAAVKVANFSAFDGDMTHAAVQRLLGDAHVLDNSFMMQAFIDRKVVVYVEVGEGHWHSITPHALRRLGRLNLPSNSLDTPILASCNDQATNSSRPQQSPTLPLLPDTPIPGPCADLPDHQSPCSPVFSRTCSPVFIGQPSGGASLPQSEDVYASDDESMLTYDVDCPWLEPNWLKQVRLCCFTHCYLYTHTAVCTL